MSSDTRSMNTRPRLTAPVRAFPETFLIIDTKFGRHCGTYANLDEAKRVRSTNRSRYQIDSRREPCFRVGPCSWCGWTSRLHMVKSAADEEARQHRATHRTSPAGTRS